MLYQIRYAKHVHSKLITNEIHPSQQDLSERAEWFAKLEQSILQIGFRNPVVLTAKDGKITPRYGGSRVMIAQKHNLNIPAIIADFDNMFSSIKPIEFNQIQKYFLDKPKSIILKPYGINISGCADSHITMPDD